MIRNYLKVAFRSLRRNKGYTLINILGLAIGIAFSCMMYIYVTHELSSDSFHEKSDRIFRVIMEDKRNPDNVRFYGSAPAPLTEALLNEIPEIEDHTRLYRTTGQIVYQLDGQNFQEREWYITHSNFFEIFDFEFIAGDKNTALNEPLSLVINRSTAIKLFGKENAVGELISSSWFGSLKVTGVVKDFPENSHIKFNFLLSENPQMEGWKNLLTDWEDFSAFAYVLLKPNVKIATVNAKVPDFITKFFGPYAQVFNAKFQNIEDIYFESEDIEGGIEEFKGQLSYIYIFATMGLFILLIACINYINLATSKAAYRSREIGIRKVVGAFKRQLITQFLMESLLVSLIAMVLAVGIIDLAFPYFNQITGKSFDINLTNLGMYLPTLLLLAVIIALFSGGYPALYLSHLKPVSSIKGQEIGGKKSGGMRKGLVTFQFVLTIVMLVVTLLIGQQLNYIQDKDMGFDKDKLLVIDINNGNVRRQFQTMKTQYEAIPGVESVGVSSRVPGEWKNINEVFAKPNSANWEGTDSIKTYYMGFDDGMLETYQFKLAAGSYFTGNDGDSTNVLINESAAKAMGLTNPVGTTINVKSYHTYWRADYNAKVVGVLKDFNFQSLHTKIEPIIIATWNNPVRPIDYFTLKISGNAPKVIEGANAVHEKFDLYSPMEYHFLDQQLNTFYEAEERAGLIFKMAAALCIFVACLGLLGLASFMVEKRKKELGIRKILGANEVSLFVLLSSSISKQVILAFIIASPLAWYIISNWLAAFEYRISIGPGTFIVAGLVAVSIALITISYRALQAIYSNPVDSLRSE
ncbi:MAG: ABC transporter permease [Bacteroidota bacterium]